MHISHRSPRQGAAKRQTHSRTQNRDASFRSELSNLAPPPAGPDFCCRPPLAPLPTKPFPRPPLSDLETSIRCHGADWFYIHYVTERGSHSESPADPDIYIYIYICLSLYKVYYIIYLQFHPERRTLSYQSSYNSRCILLVMIKMWPMTWICFWFGWISISSH